jgi:multidrug efflux pump subunit AcrA (membrane-fusion protein)
MWINGVLAVLLIGLATWGYFSVGDPGRTQTVSSRNATVTRGTLTASISGSGNTASAAQVGVDFTNSGTLTAVDVKVGQHVRTGQVLATIDPGSARQDLAAAEAQLATAQASYDQTAAGQSAIDRTRDQIAVASARLSVTSAQASLNQALRQQALDARQQAGLVAAAEAALAAGTGTQAQVTTAKQNAAQTALKDAQSVSGARLQVESAKNQLAQQEATAAADAATPTPLQLAQAQSSLQSAKAQVEQAQVALDATTLRAPQAGTVVSVSASVGEQVSGGGSSSSSGTSGTSGGTSGGTGGSGSSGGTGNASSSSGGSGFIVIADLTRMSVTTNIAESDVTNVAVGQSARVTLTASGTTLDGTVTDVALQSSTSNNVVQYPVTVTLTSVPEGVRLGATASVTIVTGQAQDALSVPTAAITTRGGISTVTVIRNGSQVVVPVQTGLEGASSTQIVDGLVEGETVVLASTSGSGTSTGVPPFGGPVTRIGGPP